MEETDEINEMAEMAEEVLSCVAGGCRTRSGQGHSYVEPSLEKTLLGSVLKML